MKLSLRREAAWKLNTAAIDRFIDHEVLPFLMETLGASNGADFHAAKTEFIKRLDSVEHDPTDLVDEDEDDE